MPCRRHDGCAQPMPRYDARAHPLAALLYQKSSRSRIDMKPSDRCGRYQQRSTAQREYDAELAHAYEILRSVNRRHDGGGSIPGRHARPRSWPVEPYSSSRSRDSMRKEAARRMSKCASRRPVGDDKHALIAIFDDGRFRDETDAPQWQPADDFTISLSSNSAGMLLAQKRNQ